MKTETTLKDYLAQGHSQESLAKALDVSQGAIQQMNASSRDIRLVITEKEITAYEVSPVPKKRKQKA